MTNLIYSIFSCFTASEIKVKSKSPLKTHDQEVIPKQDLNSFAQITNGLQKDVGQCAK